MFGLGPWPFRVLWVILPLTTGPLFATALADADEPFQTTASIGLWAVWAAVLVVSMVPRTTTLTAIRVAGPAGLVATIWAAVEVGGDATNAAIVGVCTAAAAIVALLSADLGRAFVAGSAYGAEQRLPLRAPAAVFIGPLPLAWAIAVAGIALGPILLAAQRWVAGAIVTAVGLPLAGFAIRSLHVLSRRWLVLVPAGVVLHDQMALREPVLFPRSDVLGLGPAAADTDALDLTLGSFGLALQIDLEQAIDVGLRRRDAGTDELALTPLRAFLFTPTQPGAVMRQYGEHSG